MPYESISSPFILDTAGLKSPFFPPAISIPAVDVHFLQPLSIYSDLQTLFSVRKSLSASMQGAQGQIYHNHLLQFRTSPASIE
jgi:hypothetical protein